MSRNADNQLVNLLLRDSEGRAQEFLSDLTINADGSKSFVVGRRGQPRECWRHTIQTVFVEPRDGEFSEVK